MFTKQSYLRGIFESLGYTHVCLAGCNPVYVNFNDANGNPGRAMVFTDRRKNNTYQVSIKGLVVGNEKCTLDRIKDLISTIYIAHSAPRCTLVASKTRQAKRPWGAWTHRSGDTHFIALVSKNNFPWNLQSKKPTE